MYVVMKEKSLAWPRDAQTPLTAKHPAARLMPFTAVEVAVPVMLSAAIWSPPTKVEVPLCDTKSGRTIVVEAFPIARRVVVPEKVLLDVPTVKTPSSFPRSQ